MEQIQPLDPENAHSRSSATSLNLVEHTAGAFASGVNFSPLMAEWFLVVGSLCPPPPQPKSGGHNVLVQIRSASAFFCFRALTSEPVNGF